MAKRNEDNEHDERKGKHAAHDEREHKEEAKSYATRPSYADDGQPRFAVGFEEDGRFYFLRHVGSQQEADNAVRDYEEQDKREAEVQEERNKRMRTNKAVGFHQAEHRGEYVNPEFRRWSDQHSPTTHERQ
jgi:hypothetical protein